MNPAPDQPVRPTSAEVRSREVVVEKAVDIEVGIDAGADEMRSAAAAAEHVEQAVDDAVEMTFPASDPPAWMSSGTLAASSDAIDATRASADD